MAEERLKDWRGFADRELWARVRALHAQWQVHEPGLRLIDTASRLIEFGLVQPDRVLEYARQHEAVKAAI